MNLAEGSLKAVLNECVDAELGPRRSAPPFVAEVEPPSRSGRWVLPLLAAVLVLLLAGGTTVAISVRRHSAPAAPTVPSNPPTPTAPSTASTPPESSATTTAVLRPVDAAGTVAPGYSIKDETSQTVDCTTGGTTPSQVAIDADIVFCGPSAAGAVACWRDPNPSYVLCVDGPWSRQVDKLRAASPAPSTRPVATAVPIGLVLDNGVQCTIRDGGSWSQLSGHPGWSGTYACEANFATVVWQAPGSATAGIDESTGTWTVQTGSATGTGGLTTHRVAQAYFVGTFGATP